MRAVVVAFPTRLYLFPMASVLRPDQLDELRAIFDLFDGDGDGLLEVEEVGTVWAACGTVLTEAEVLDMVTEAQPNLRKLPFDEFVQMMTRPMVSTQALEEELRATFPRFSQGKANITADTLAAGLAELGRPVEPLLSKEMVDEGRGNDPSGAGKMSLAEFCAMNSVGPPKPKKQPAAAAPAPAVS